jgi:hypothetical protein
MRLINVRTFKLEEFVGSQIPRYAILSHVWQNDEVSFDDMMQADPRTKKGWSKVQKTCEIALKNGIHYAWVDTCCIDKRSSSELTEAINSMFAWYRDSVECYAYLSDLFPSEQPIYERLKDCRWFTRGWTLQELLAPGKVIFYDHFWTKSGVRSGLSQPIQEITGIPAHVLLGSIWSNKHPVATKLSWAAMRKTTRPEDLAYCLLGLFDVNMPLIYGEGAKAFKRLQEQIIQKTCDWSIFLWRPSHRFSTASLGDLLAPSPDEFQWLLHRSVSVRDGFDTEFTFTHKGIRFSSYLLELPKGVTFDDTTARQSGVCRCSIRCEDTCFNLSESCHAMPLGCLVSLDKRGPRELLDPAWIILRKMGPDTFIREISFRGGIFVGDIRSTAGSSIRRAPQHTFYVNSGGDHVLSEEPPLMNLVFSGYDLIGIEPQTRWDGSRELLFCNSRPSVDALILRPALMRSSLDHILLAIINRGTASRLFCVLNRRTPEAEHILNNISTATEHSLWNSSFNFNQYCFSLMEGSDGNSYQGCQIQGPNGVISLGIELSTRRSTGFHPLLQLTISDSVR